MSGLLGRFWKRNAVENSVCLLKRNWMEQVLGRNSMFGQSYPMYLLFIGYYER